MIQLKVINNEFDTLFVRFRDKYYVCYEDDLVESMISHKDIEESFKITTDENKFVMIRVKYDQNKIPLGTINQLPGFLWADESQDANYCWIDYLGPEEDKDAIMNKITEYYDDDFWGGSSRDPRNDITID